MVEIMMVFGIVLASIFVLVLYIIAAMQFGTITEEKGYPDKKTMVIILCLFMPLAGYLMACALTDMRLVNNRNVTVVNQTPSSITGKPAVISDELPDL